MLLLSILAAALPMATALKPSYTSSLTYFHPGLGACGHPNADADFIVAISAALYDRTSSCGRWIRVSGPRGTANVQVVDRCAGCAEWDLDLSPSAFGQVVGNLGVGRTQGSWEWA